MLELPHVVVGATIATLIPNPAIALPLALASHFLTDYIPHWNPHLNSEKKQLGHYTNSSILVVIIDASLALFVGTAIAARFLPDTNRFLIVMFACFLSVAPDVVEIPHFFFKTKIDWMEKLIKFQTSHQWNVPVIWGILSQAIVITTCLYFIATAI